MCGGVLEYVLLGIDFHVSSDFQSSTQSLIFIETQANFQNTYLGGILILVAFINASIDFYHYQI